MQNYWKHYCTVYQCWLLFRQSRCIHSTASHLQQCIWWSIQSFSSCLNLSHLQAEYNAISNNFRFIHKHKLQQGTSWWSSSNSTGLHYNAQYCTYSAVSETGWDSIERRNLPNCLVKAHWESTNSPERKDATYLPAPVQDQPHLVCDCDRIGFLQKHWQVAERQFQVRVVLFAVHDRNCIWDVS